MTTKTPEPGARPARQCSNCRFSGPGYQLEGEPLLRCRRHPPVILPGLPGGLARFPMVLPTTCCGEYRWNAAAMALPSHLRPE
jgi:hypothetical protein